MVNALRPFDTRQRAVTAIGQVPMLLNGGCAWSAAPQKKREVAGQRLALINDALERVKRGARVETCARLLIAQIGQDDLTMAQAVAIEALGAPSLATIKRWLNAALTAQESGDKALVMPRHTGRVRKDYGWEARAIELFNTPSKAGKNNVAFKLRCEGFETATDSRVASFLGKLPATLGSQSPERIGKHLHQLTHRAFYARDWSSLKAGQMVAGDGHTIDVYLANPVTGRPYRPELTVFIDVYSGYIFGLHLSDSESQVSTMFALSNGISRHQHVPLYAYLDRGPGYRGKMMSGAETGFFARVGIEPIAALPGNPHGKGWIEQFFRILRDNHDKFYGPDYCGNDQAAEVNRRITVEIDSGRRTLPSVQAYAQSLADFIEQYHHKAKPSRNGKTPAQLWAELERNELHLSAADLARPTKVCTVRRQSVTLDGRVYQMLPLAYYDGREVMVGYDLVDDAQVWVSTKAGEHLGIAKLVHKAPVIPASRMDERLLKAAQEKLKRVERKRTEIIARTAPVIDDQTRARQLAESAPALTQGKGETTPLQFVDLELE